MVLAVPVPIQEVPGNFFTGALWNAQIYNGLTFTLNPPLFEGIQTVAQAVSNNTWTALTIDTEIVDTYGGHSTVTNTSRYTPTAPGYYTVQGITVWATSATGGRGARLHLNGALVQGASTLIGPSPSFGTGVCTPVREFFMNGTTDYLELAGWQLSGGALNTGINLDQVSGLWVRWSHA